MRLKYKLRNIRYSIKWAYQRVKRGYDDRALWNTDCWFRDTIIPILEWHRDKRDYVLRNPDTNEEWSHEEANKVFDQMIHLMKYSDPDELLNEWGKEYDFTREELIKAGDITEQNKNDFFKMFSKYFYQLWD